MADVVYIAVRDYEQAENSLIKKYNSTVFNTFDVHRIGPKEVALQAIEHLKHCDIIYVSFDVDAMDPCVSTGTGTPFENGLYAYETKELLKTLLSFEKAKCFEITEINPTLDNKNSMGHIAFEILKSACRVIDLRNKD
jgi:arginase